MTDQPTTSAPEPAATPSVAAAPPTAAPDPAPAAPRSFLRRWGWLIVGLVIVAAIVVVLAPLASPDPDGLESVAGQQGWLESAQGAVYDLLPDYTIPGLDGSASTVVSGLIGVGIVFLAMLGLGWVLRRRRAPRA
ncbi:MAG: PDGLE domain-containing protein [Chloroflexi bacterium]|jgi:MYXO-CTERM domain-containing protein|nr:PDGLE domain-containing protein [Chloroflexota bacterium]